MSALSGTDDGEPDGEPDAGPDGVGDAEDEEDGDGDTLLPLSPARGVPEPLAQPASRPPMTNVASRVNRRVPMAVGRYRLPDGSVDIRSTGVIRP
jgi:hypothetical protein